MRIGIVGGSGNMGRALGIIWAERGHDVMFGSRDAAKAVAAAKLAGPRAKGGTNDEAAAFGEVVVYTVRGVMPSKLLQSPQSLDGKVVVCINNRVIPKDFAFESFPQSLAEDLAADAKKSRVVKAFNTMAQEVFEHAPEPLREHDVSVFLCGDDEAAKAIVAELSSDLGFTPVDCGPLRSARMVESLGDFIRYMMFGMKRGFFATLSVKNLPETKTQRLGGRKAYVG